MDQPVYVIGDVHGQMAFLADALRWVEADGGRDAPHVFVGDLVDRGPDSRAVITYLMDQSQTRDWTVLKGNHDRLFTDYIQSGSLNDGCLRPDFTWFHERMGARDTLASYGVTVTEDVPPPEKLAEARAAVPQAHIDWLHARPIRHETGTHFFAHAGIRPGVPLADQTEDDLLWIRKDFHDHSGPHPKVIVHGHTPVDIPLNYGHRINTDGGAGYGRPIYPVVLEGGDVYMLTATGRALI